MKDFINSMFDIVLSLSYLWAIIMLVLWMIRSKR